MRLVTAGTLQKLVESVVSKCTRLIQIFSEFSFQTVFIILSFSILRQIQQDLPPSSESAVSQDEWTIVHGRWAKDMWNHPPHPYLINLLPYFLQLYVYHWLLVLRSLFYRSWCDERKCFDCESLIKNTGTAGPYIYCSIPPQVPAPDALEEGVKRPRSEQLGKKHSQVWEHAHGSWLVTPRSNFYLSAPTGQVPATSVKFFSYYSELWHHWHLVAGRSLCKYEI